MEQAGYIAIGVLVGLVVGIYGSFRFLQTSLHVSSSARDQWVKTLHKLATAEEVQRWKRGEFL